MVAAAVVGSAVVSAGSSAYGAKQSGKALSAGSEAASATTIETAQMQIGEIQRQFDYQMQILEPMVQQQYAAGAAYQDLLGFGGGRVSDYAQPAANTDITQQAQAATQPGTPRQIAPGGGAYRPGADQPRLQNAVTGTPARSTPSNYMAGGGGAVPDLLQIGGDSPTYNRELYATSPAYRQAWGELEQWHRDTYGRDIRGDSTPSILDRKLREFMEGNPDFEGYEGLAQQTASASGYQSRNVYPERGATNFMRGENGEFIDPNLDPTKLAGPSMQDDEYFNYITNGGQGVYGNEFESSPGYEFAREEMNRSLDRRNSAGGNFGGRAIMEAQRRAKGLADQEFYNWASGRERDLSRGSRAAENYLVREATDLQRTDAGYYNFLNNTARAAGFGNSAGEAVNSSENVARTTSSALGQQGSSLASNYLNTGNTQAQIEANRAAGINNAATSGIQNYITADAAGLFK